MDDKDYDKMARGQWAFWRLIVEGMISYTEACQMSFDEMMEANAALDYYIELLDKKNSK